MATLEWYRRVVNCVVASVIAHCARAQLVPYTDTGFTDITPSPDVDAVIVRERSFSALTNVPWKNIGAHDYIQSIYVRFYRGTSGSNDAWFTGSIVFPPGITVRGVITDAADLGGAADDNQLTESDLLFSIGSDPNAYSAYARGFETSGLSDEFVCQTDSSTVVFGLNIDDGVDDFRIIIDYGNSFPPGLAFRIDGFAVNSPSGDQPSTGFQVGNTVDTSIFGSGDFEFGSLDRIPLTTAPPDLPTQFGDSNAANPSFNLSILRNPQPGGIKSVVDFYNVLFESPAPKAITLESSMPLNWIGLTDGPDGKLYALTAKGYFAAIDALARTSTVELPADTTTTDDYRELTDIPGTRHLLFFRDRASGPTYVDRFDVDTKKIVARYTIPSTMLGNPAGGAVSGYDGMVYVVGTGGNFVRFTPTLPPSGTIEQLPSLPVATNYAYEDLDASSSSTSPYVFAVRNTSSGIAVVRFNCATAQMDPSGFSLVTSTGIASPAGITEGPGGDFYVIGVGSSGPPGFVRFDPTPSTPLTGPVAIDCGISQFFGCTSCMDFNGSNVDIAFVGPLKSQSYCTPGTTLHGCTVTLGSTGQASITSPSGFTISAAGVEGQRTGILFYGASGALIQPWATASTSYLCVRPPTQRTGIQNSGGTPNVCDGSLALDFNAFRTANPNALGQPMVLGQTLQAQAWFRDPGAAKNTSLSNALSFNLGP